MKKLMLVGILAVSSSLFAHHQFLYTDKMEVSGEKAINVKLYFGHPNEGKEAGAINVATVGGKEHAPVATYVVRNGEKKDLLSKVRSSKIKTDKNTARIFEFDYGLADGLTGQGDWVFFMAPGRAEDSGYGFTGAAKLIVIKEETGKDWNRRVADGYAEIIPMTSPVGAWKESGFVAKVVDAKGNPVEGARIDAAMFNAKIDSKNNVFKGGNKVEKGELQMYTDPNGVFHFAPPVAGKWVMRANMPRKAGSKEVFDATLLVDFK